MADLKDFLASLAIDPKKLGEFIHDPEAAMTREELSEEDKATLKSGFPALIHARLAGMSVQDAFKITIQPSVSPQQFVFPVQMPQQFIYQQLPPQFIHQLPPQFIYQQLPPQFIHQLPPQFIYQQLPPQFIHQLPPQFIYQQLPPQFIYQSVYQPSTWWR
jgi:hypothetical protein